MKNVGRICLCIITILFIATGAIFGTGDYKAQGAEIVTDFTKNGVHYMVLSKEKGRNYGTVAVSGIDEKADKDLIKNLKIPFELRKNQINYTVVKIDNLAFESVTGISSITIEEGITEIGTGAFCNCSDLKKLIIPSTVKTMPSTAFFKCSALKNIIISEENKLFSSADGVVYSKDGKTLIAAPGISGKYLIQDGVTAVGEYAFAYNENLTFVTFPMSVISISGYSFYNCTNLSGVKLKAVETIGKNAFSKSGLKSIKIPESTSKITENPFSFCDRLEEIKVAKLNDNYKASKNLLLTKSGKKLISASAAENGIQIPSTVTKIGKYAFAGNKRITRMVIGDKIKNIYEGAFCYCTSLNKIRFMSRKTGLSVPNETEYGIFFNTVYELIVEVPYSEKGFEEGSIEQQIEINSPKGVDIITF
ncbi:MAG: leucine-rich repeat domain-containing protein [Lachnospiraceae bacterium]|nr:leucine-rich repeat domain-containing protein [Lachnospiraceae bacterium]